MLNVYIDGSAHNNGMTNSNGGYGIVIFEDDDYQHIVDFYSKYCSNVTNNQMELNACLKAFQILDTKFPDKEATIYSDSSYCVNILSSWIYTWANNGWRNSKNQIVKNLDIIIPLYEYYKKNSFISQVKFAKIKGHDNLLGNELADALATADVKKIKKTMLKNHIRLSERKKQELRQKREKKNN